MDSTFLLIFFNFSMKKIVSTISAILLISGLAISSTFAASAPKLKLEVQNTQLAKNGATYLKLTAFKADGTPFESEADLGKYQIKINPSYALTVDNFKSCTGDAEGRDTCNSIDPEFAKVRGSFFSQVKAKEIEGKASIAVYASGQVASVDVTVGATNAVGAEETPVEEVAATGDMDQIESGGELHGKWFAVAFILLTVGVVATRRKQY